MKHVLFKLVTLSNNANSFGLRGAVILAKDGMAWEIGINHLSVDYFQEHNKQVTLGVDDAGDLHSIPEFSFEIPRRLPDAPPGVVQELFGDAGLPA